MILDRLVLKNFKRFREQEIRFHDGITGILGNNGTGKSSIVQAIFFALYGVQATGIAPDYIVSSFASPRERCEVRLDFRIEGAKYTVVRTFKKGKAVQHDATFHRDGQLRATGVSQVETEVRRTLGMGPVDFKNTIYAAQKDLLTLLENTPGKRKEWFLRALGIDYLNTESQKILKEQIDGKSAGLQRMEGTLEALARGLNAEEFAALQASVSGFSEELGELKKQHDGLSEKKKALDEEFRLYQDQRTKYTELTMMHLALSREQDGLKEQLALTRSNLTTLVRLELEYHLLAERLTPFPEKKEARDALRKLKSEHDQARTAVRSAERECLEAKDRAELAKARIASLDKDAGKRAALIVRVRNALKVRAEIGDYDLEHHVASAGEEITHAIGTIFAQLKSLENGKKKLLSDRDTIRNAGAGGTCPLCRQKLGSHYTSIEEEYRVQLERIDHETAGLSEKHKKATGSKDVISAQKPVLSEIRSLTEKLKMRVSFEAELNDMLSQLKAKDAACTALVQKIQDLRFEEEHLAKAEQEVAGLEKSQERFNDLRGELAKAEVLKKQVADLEGQITKKQAEIERIFSGIEQSSFDPKKSETLERSRVEIETSVRSVAERTAQTTERMKYAEEKIAEYRSTEAQVRNLKKQSGNLKEEIELLKLTRTVIGGYVIYLMQVVRSRLEGEVSRIISEITAGRYEQVLLDEDFNLLVRDIDDDYAIERFSGGEQDDIAVALRIALSRYLAELHNVHESTLLIFDEIFGSQDEERRNNLLTSLRTQESRFPQIILISHISEMQGEFSNTLVVEMGPDMTSRVREVAD
ncbi:MAG: SMC family ATPase [Methanoregula sp.]|jgi:exonuclease SbcC